MYLLVVRQKTPKRQRKREDAICTRKDWNLAQPSATRAKHRAFEFPHQVDINEREEGGAISAAMVLAIVGVIAFQAMVVTHAVARPRLATLHAARATIPRLSSWLNDHEAQTSQRELGTGLAGNVHAAIVDKLAELDKVQERVAATVALKKPLGKLNAPPAPEAAAPTDTASTVAAPSSQPPTAAEANAPAAGRERKLSRAQQILQSKQLQRAQALAQDSDRRQAQPHRAQAIVQGGTGGQQAQAPAQGAQAASRGPGRHRAIQRAQAAALGASMQQAQGGTPGGGGGASASGAPPIDGERRSRSPGLLNNFYETSLSDFKRPHGSSGVVATPSPEGMAPAAAPAGAGPGGFGAMSPMPGREEEYKTFQTQTTGLGGVMDSGPTPPIAPGAPPAAPAGVAVAAASTTIGHTGQGLPTEYSAEAARATEAMHKILLACAARTEARVACEAGGSPAADSNAWREEDERGLIAASERLEGAKVRLVEATRALRDMTASSANLLGSVADDIHSYRDAKQRWNREVDTLARRVEEAAREEEQCRGAVHQLEQAKARAAPASSLAGAIESEAVALALKTKLIDAIMAIEQLG